MLRRALLLTIVALAVAQAVPAAPAAAPLTVLAASSLTESMHEVARAWQAAGNGAVTLSFDASSRLAKQIEAGAPADVFVSADLQWSAYLDGRGLTVPSSRAVLAGNALVAVVGARAAFAPGDARGLADPAVRHLALAGENVPAGTYARAALTALGVMPAVQDRVVAGENVRTALSWVAAGEAEAGVVYVTDARVEPRVRVAFTFPASSYPPVVYPASVVAASAHAADAARFVAYCRSPAAQAVFAAAGFLPPP